MNNRTKPILLIFVSIIIFLIITNPGMQKFNEFSNREDRINRQRTSNFLIFSIYEVTSYDYLNTYRYVGIAFNFFEIDYN